MTKAGRTVSALFYSAGLLLMGADALLFLLDWPQAGPTFCIGLGICAMSALASERAKPEDVVTILVAVALIALVVVRSL